MKTIRIIQGDITTAKTDAIVNAANSIMLGGGGVDGAIHRAAGPGLLNACRKVPLQDGIRCPAGQAKITEAGDLAAKYVIHAVGPRYGIDPNPEKLLGSAYQHCLDLALDYGCRSIAFPAISCGVYRFPKKEAAQISISVCSRKAYDSLEKIFYLFSNDLTGIWEDALNPDKS